MDFLELHLELQTFTVMQRLEQRISLFVEHINLLKTIQANENRALPPFFSKFANQHGLAIHPRKFRNLKPIPLAAGWRTELNGKGSS